MGWGAAFDYHLRTYDQLAEACDPRQLQLACGGTDWRSAPPPPTSAALATLSKPFDKAWNAAPDRSTTGVAKVVALLAAGGSAAPAIERYLVADALEGCDPGVWRYDPGSARLDWVAGLPSAATLGAMLHGPSRRPYRPAAFLLLTAVWERYMRRRPLGWAYRTVFMEAGHVAATLEVAARALGVPVFWQHGVDDHAWHDLIGVDPAGMQEGVLYAAAIGRAKTGA